MVRPTAFFPIRDRGLTIIELMVTLAILSVLAAAVLPLGEALLVAQKERELRQALWQIRGAIDDYKRASERGQIRAAGTSSGYPPNLEALALGVADARLERQGQAIYFLRSLPRDPFADPALPPEKTWRLRSYASPPSRPLPGVDVFDVYSSSDATAMDGTPYAKW